MDLYPDPLFVIEESGKRGIYVLSVTTTPSAWTQTNELAKNHSRIKTALGLHPQLAKERFTELKLFDVLFSKTRYVGEIGLDGSRENRSFWDKQLQVFHHILSACENSIETKILSIHSRNAAKSVLENLSNYPNAGEIILHWFSGNKTELEIAISRGYWFSINPRMFYSKKGLGIIQQLPKNKILLESDGPFAQVKQKSIFPWDMDISIKGLSETWRISEQDVKGQIMTNFNVLLKSEGRWSYQVWSVCINQGF